MPISLEEFRKLSSNPIAKDGVKSGKCNWSIVQVEITGHAWSVKEVWEIAKKHSPRGISRTRTKRWLDKLVEKKIAVSKIDGLAVIYWINPSDTAINVATKTSNVVVKKVK